MSTNYDRYAAALPLASFYILVAVERRPLYAYAIQEQIRHDSDGAVAPGRSSVDNAIKRLESWGFIAPDAASSYQDSRRGVSYTLTQAGQTRLKHEIAHLERAVRIGNRTISTSS